MDEELFYKNQLQDLEKLKSEYFRQLDEIEKERAEIALKKEEIKADRSFLIEEYGKLRAAKKVMLQEYETLLVKNDDLDNAKKVFNKKKETFSAQEKELEIMLHSYELDLEELKKRKSEQYRTLRSQYEDDLYLLKQQKRLKRTKNRLKRQEIDIEAKRKAINSDEIDIEVHMEKIGRRLEYIKNLKNNISSDEKELMIKTDELSVLKTKILEETGNQETIHRQHLHIVKKDTRIEQQLNYITTLEEKNTELEIKLNRTLQELNQLKVHSRILDENIELLCKDSSHF